MPGPSRSSAGAGARRSQAEALEPFFPKNDLGKGSGGGSGRSAGGLGNSPHRKMCTLSNPYKMLSGRWRIYASQAWLVRRGEAAAALLLRAERESETRMGPNRRRAGCTWAGAIGAWR